MRLLVDLVVVLVAARAAAEVAQRVGLPAVPFEIAAGIVVGPSAAGLVHASATLRALGALGAVVLLFEVGIAMDVDDLVRSRWVCTRVAIAGVVVSIGLGLLAARAAGVHGAAAVLVAAAIAPTSVGVSARVFHDLRALGRREARTVLGAGVIDDIVGLLILSAVLRGAAGGARPAWEVVAIAVGFLAVAGVGGTVVVPRIFDALQRHSRVRRSLLVPALALAFGLARLAQAAGLAQIIGAFVAGLVLVPAKARDDIARSVIPVGEFLTPIFFVLIGIDARVRVFAHGDVVILAALLLAAAVVGKLAAGAVSARGSDRLAVAAGMMPRGEVTLIFAAAGLEAATIGRSEFGALVAVVLVTAIISPIALRRRLHR